LQEWEDEQCARISTCTRISPKGYTTTDAVLLHLVDEEVGENPNREIDAAFDFLHAQARWAHKNRSAQ